MPQCAYQKGNERAAERSRARRNKQREKEAEEVGEQEQDSAPRRKIVRDCRLDNENASSVQI